MSSGQTSSSSGSKREIKRQPVTDLPEQRSDTSEFLSFRPEIPPPTTPQKSKRPTRSMPDYDEEMMSVPLAAGPSTESANSPRIYTPVDPQQPAMAQAMQDDGMTKVLQMMAQSLTKLNETSRNSTPVYASQLPPYPADSVPTFDGNNVTLFLERFEDMAKYYEFTSKMMIERLTAHCKAKQRAIIQASDEYEESLQTTDWSTLRAALKKRFRTNDKYQQEVRAEYFEHWLAQCQARTELSTLEYLQEFHIRSKRCIESGTIEKGRRGFYLVKGLPLKQATRVLEKFQLRTDSPLSFDYKKISDYLSKRMEVEEDARMLNPAEAIKEFEPEAEFDIAAAKEAQAKSLKQPAIPDQKLIFQPPSLNIPLREYDQKPAPKPAQKQLPPGSAPTKNEVDGLVDKMLQLKLNKANLEIEPWSLQWTPREAELMANQVIRGEVNRQADERATALRSYMPQAYLAPPAQNPRYNNAMNYQQTQGQQSQQGYQQSNQRPIGYQNYSNNSQTFQPKTGYGNQNNQYSQVAGAGFLCWVCDKTGHQKNDCPTLRGFVDKGWCYLDERSQLNWGTPSNPQGRITNLGTRRWAEAISAEIKRRWIKQDIDPLSYESPFLKDPQSSLPVENNAISVQLVPDSSGTITADDYEQFWNLSSVLGETDSDTSSQLRGANQCNNNTVASATIARADTRKKPSASHNPSKVQKAAPKAVLKRPPEEHIPHLRGHKNRDDNYFLDRNLSKDRTVQFADTPGPADTDMLDAPVDSEPKKAPKDPQPETKDKHTRKHRIVEKLAPDAQKVIQQILDTEISLPLKTVLGNMPEVRKKLFQQGYTTEEFNKLQINATSHSLEQESCESDSDEGLRPISLVNSLSLGQLPDYVLVEAVAGRVTQCYHIDAEHWTDAQISHVQQHIIAEEDQDVGPVADDSIDSQQEYDRAAGIEHLRRDCPKVPIEIRGNNFLTLLDSGAELNTMKRETAEKANLPITSLPKSMSSARMVSANGTTECFVGIVWGVPIRIGRIEVRTNFFVIESCTNPIILGNPFLTDARARIEYATNGLTYCRIFSEDGEFNTRFLAECGSTGYVSSVQARMGMTGTEREGEEMKPVTEWLKKKRLEKPRAPSEQKYFCWGPNTFLGKGPDGTIVVKDEEGLFVVANECAESLSDNILSEVVGALGGCEYEERGVDVVWKEQLSDIRKNKTGMPIEVVTMVKLKPSEAQKEKGHFEVNGMHKRKGQKVEPIDDSGQAPRKVEGRLDWKERAKAKQVPNADHARAPFAQYFEPRYADFPRGTRVTPERLKEMKISPDLWPRERQLLEELLFRREAALAWDFRESEEPEEDVEDFIEAHLNAVQLVVQEIYDTTPALQYGCCPADLSFSDKPLDDCYSEESQQLAAWILFRKRPEHLNKAEFRKFKQKALRMTVRERHLFTLPSGGRPLRRVVDDPAQQQEIIRELHDNSGHRGKEGTWRKVWTRYHWKGQYEQVKN
ncbi:Asp-protease-2 domain containing protein [Pyrenophora tritici-repentis]|nr:Asp-protease-2 domain containing protein [Pyrenophora tritici-repentis]KAF7453940.1 Asp-protease-2 domain containing protein [Pyrenophora tritici-repentis]